MATKERIKQIRITLPLIAVCLPLFVNHYVKAENGCPYETYLRIEGKCVDISERGLNEITQELEEDAVLEVSKEIAEVSQELEELGRELEEFCHQSQPETSTQVEIVEDVCQY
ncbi:MAG: hypothetical protein AAFQ41_13165 [Cyanobacteria bacterium J06623_7]